MQNLKNSWFREKAVPILSLDSIRPFFQEMGLCVPDEANFQKLLRQSLVAFRPSRASGVRPPDPAVWVSEVVSRMTTIFGDTFVAKFRKWMSSVLFPPPDLPYNAWRLIFSDLSRSPESWQYLELPPDQAEPLRKRYSTLTDWAPVQAIADRVKAQPLSEWDLAIFALYNFYEEANDPVAEALAASKRRHLFTFWRELEQAATVDKQRMLLRAQVLAKKKGMTLTLGLLDSGDWPTW